MVGPQVRRRTEIAYRTLGQRRVREGVPLGEVVYALMLTERTLRVFIQTDGWVNSALELHQQVELYNLIDEFFGRATYFTVLSYEEEARSAGEPAAGAHQLRSQKGGLRWSLGNRSNVA